MADKFDELRKTLDDIVTRQTQIEQGLHMLLDALQTQLPLITEMSDRLTAIEANVFGIEANITRIECNIASIEDAVSSIRFDLEYKTDAKRHGE
jgi:predicted  nucleic acid-binding Zn-ribbon protein